MEVSALQQMLRDSATAGRPAKAGGSVTVKLRRGGHVTVK